MLEFPYCLDAVCPQAGRAGELNMRGRLVRGIARPERPRRHKAWTLMLPGFLTENPRSGERR